MDSIGGHNLQLIIFTVKQSWCAPIICHQKDMPSTDEGENGDVQIIHQASLVVYMFTIYSRKVLCILKELTLGTYSEAFIMGLKFGINSMQELQSHYYGTSEGARRKKVARVNLKKI